MLRLALPAFLLLAAGFVTWQNLDGDAEYYLLPFLDVLPFVGEDLPARGVATSVVLFGFAGLSLVLQGWSWARARRREREVQDVMDEADAVRDWRESAAWDEALTSEEDPPAAPGADGRPGRGD